ncbi:hypothetical protein QBC32DRAFT_128000 [Pseudoneurospora amorphoporcata]|uniref:Uncharacterized protein n=1 Tax=Pseudoneurospora amorphoporcata TaxID=241081 RepID=A0AAN6NY40_9PEZI|nr:hypothetical protein QBC32DRAFT_128000 [Pseudoneurospora amorphoporcata]
MKLPPNIPTALILTFLFSLQVPLRLAAPLSHDKLFPGSEPPIVPLTLPQQIRYERINNGRIGTRHSNPNSNRDFPSPLPDSFAVPPGSTGAPVYPPGRLLGRLQKRGGTLDSNSWDATAAAAAAAAVAQLSQLKRGNSLPKHSQPPPSKPSSSSSSSRPGRYPRPLKHLFAHSYHSNTGRGVLTVSADDDLNLFNDGRPQSLLKMMTFEPTITINSTSIERRGPGGGSYLAAMSIGGATLRPRSREAAWERMERRAGGWEGDDRDSERVSGDWSEGSFMSRRVSRVEKRLGMETTGKNETETTGEMEEREESVTGKGSKRHGRYHDSLTSVSPAA